MFNILEQLPMLCECVIDNTAQSTKSSLKPISESGRIAKKEPTTELGHVVLL